MTALLLCGASVRAAAWSAHRAGFRSLHALDLFGDEDLRCNAQMQVVPMEEYPDGLARRVHGEMPLVYTGGLENHPRLVNRLAFGRALWGNPGEVLRAVRDPFRLTQALQEAGLPFAPVRRGPPVEREAVWLCKRRRSASGQGVRVWDGGPSVRGEYWQRFIPGVSYAAIFCGSGEGDCLLLGVTRQLLRGEGDSSEVLWSPSLARRAPRDAFQYCGSIGPVELGEEVNRTLQRLGATLVQRFGLRGLFGVDFILHQGQPIPVEVNPRYTASIEVLERETGLAFMSIHCEAFGAIRDGVAGYRSPRLRRGMTFSQVCCAKSILFARQDLIFPADGPWLSSIVPWQDNSMPEFADLPRPGTSLSAGQPILTVFASGRDHDDCLVSLRQKVTLTESWLYA